MVSILLVPQAIAYAYLAGVPPQYGLYAALAPIFVYALFGTSPHIAIGPVAISAILVLAGVSKLETPFSPAYIELVILAGLLIGIVQLILGLLKQGKLVNLLSFPIITGFTSAASIIIICSQLNDFLGITLPNTETVFSSTAYMVQNITETHLPTFLIGSISLVFIIICNSINHKIPSRLIIVVLGILASYFWNFSAQGIEIIGDVPSGLPSFNVPEISLDKIWKILPTVLIVSVIGIIESIGIAKAIENKNDFYEINTNRELFALGMAKVGGSFFSAIPSSASFSRSALLHQTGSKTIIASLMTVLFVIVALLFLTPYLFYLPKVILAVIIIYAVKNLFEYKIGRHLFNLHKFDFIIMLITFLSTLFISIEFGVAIGFFLSFFILNRSHISNRKGTVNILRQKFKNDITITQNPDHTSKIRIEINDSLHFGNAYHFKALVKSSYSQSIEFIEFHFANHSDMDSSAIKIFKESLKHLSSYNINYSIHTSNQKLTQRLTKSHIPINE